MPKIKNIEKIIPSFYRQKTLDVGLFFHVHILCHILKQMTIKEAVELFQETYGIDEEIYPINHALVDYARMKDKYLWRKIIEKAK